MITAVDTNVLLDVVRGDPRFGPASRRELRRCVQEGGLIACDVVWAEIAAAYERPEIAANVLSRLAIGFSPMRREAALIAGAGWRAFRSRGGKRERMPADFLIGAHARTEADRLLTRDRGFFRAYFEDLEILDPSAAS